MKRLWLFSVLLLVPGVSSCGCTLELRIDYDPDTVILAVDEATPPPQIETYGCNSPRQAVEILEWRSENPEIASVGTDTGVITGLAPGETRIIGYEEENQISAFGFPVTVVASSATR